MKKDNDQFLSQDFLGIIDFTFDCEWNCERGTWGKLPLWPDLKLPEEGESKNKDGAICFGQELVLALKGT